MSTRSDDLPKDRILSGPGTLEVYVPRKPPPKSGDIKLDFPPGLPPEVIYFGVRENYWVVLREKQMPFKDSVKVFSTVQMEWLASIEPLVEKMSGDR